MMTWLKPLALAGVVLSGAPAHAAAAKAGASEAEKEQARSGVMIPQDEKGFLDRLHASNTMEVQLGQLAQTKARSPEVKAFGQKLVTDHRGADEKIAAYAKQKGWTLEEPEPANDTERALMDADHANMAKLQALNGQAFDQAFLSSMVGDHDADIAKVKLGETKFGDLAPTLKQILPTLQQHRETAYRLLGKMAQS